MFWIKQLELTEFQKHEHLILEFNEGLNIIVGNTGVGKSCIIRGIRWLTNPSELRGDFIRREGSKQTSVKMTLNNDVIIERIKSATINRYVLTVGKDEKTYDTIGNTLPEDIQNILNIQPIEVDKEKINLNVSNQLSMPFLFDKSGSFRAKLFNKLTGNDLIDNAFQSLNKDLLQVNRDEKTEKERIEELNQTLKTTIEQRDKSKKLFDHFSKRYNNAKSLNDRMTILINYQKKLNGIKDEIGNCKKKIDNIKLVDEQRLKYLAQRINKYVTLVSLEKKYGSLVKELNKVSGELNLIEIPKIDTKELRNKINKFDILKKHLKKWMLINQTEHEISKKLTIVITVINEKEKEYKEILKSISICPFFKTPCPLSKEIK